MALNKISGAWDVPLLTALLRDLDESGFDATLTGFDVSEMSELFDDQSEIVEDDPPEQRREARSHSHSSATAGYSAGMSSTVGTAPRNRTSQHSWTASRPTSW